MKPNRCDTDDCGHEHISETECSECNCKKLVINPAEVYYDEKIAPALLELAKEANDHGLSFFAIAEWRPNQLGRTAYFTENHGPALDEMNRIAKNNRSFMSLVITSRGAEGSKGSR